MRRASVLTCPVTAVRLSYLQTAGGSHKLYVFVGCGPELRVYRLGSEVPIVRQRVLPSGTRIHGLAPREDGRILLHGAKFVAHAAFAIEREQLQILRVVEFNDWVFDTAWLFDAVAVALGHSCVVICDVVDLKVCAQFQCTDTEISWSAALCARTSQRSLEVVHGTSFGDILFWSVIEERRCVARLISTILAESEVDDGGGKAAHRLKAHDGPVMSVCFANDGTFLASASVDRSVRVWKREPLRRAEGESAGCETVQSNDGPCDTFTPFRVHYGHLARVWDVCFLDQMQLFVVSVAEDRSCRVWSSTEDGKAVSTFQGHDGRNVWCVHAVSTHDSCVIATGGEDGVVKVRQLPNVLQGARSRSPRRLNECPRDVADTLAGNPIAAAAPTVRAHQEAHRLPDNYKNPRKAAGSAANESARTILLEGPRTMYLSTDFGRLLSAAMSAAPTSGQDHLAWNSLYQDENGTAFAPNALARIGPLLIGGQTNGQVVVVHSACTVDCACRVLCKFAATGTGSRMVMSLFAEWDLEDSGVHIFVMSPHGEVFHWVLSYGTGELQQGARTGKSRSHDPVSPKSASQPPDAGGAVINGDAIHSEEEEGLQRMVAVQVACCRQEVPRKNSLGTCASYLQCCKVVLVGDRGGRVALYSAQVQSSSQRACDDAALQHPLRICRPHSDRVTCIRTVSSKHVDGLGVHDLLVGAFDGRVSRIRVSVSATESEAGAKPATLSASFDILSSQRSVERVDTIARVIFPSDPRSGSDCVPDRQCVVGFRSTNIVMWDTQQRNELFRCDCGNWRRAFDIATDLTTSAEREGPLSIVSLTFVFWRAGKLFIVKRGHTSLKQLTTL